MRDLWVSSACLFIHSKLIQLAVMHEALNSGSKTDIRTSSLFNCAMLEIKNVLVHVRCDKKLSEFIRFQFDLDSTLRF